MAHLYHQITELILAVVIVAACVPASASTPEPTAVPSSPTASVPTPIPPASTSVPVTPLTLATPLSSAPDGGTDQVIGTVVRFTAGSTLIDVAIDQDNPAVRDFLSMLPLTLTLEEFAGREKIGYLPRRLTHSGSPGSDPEDGDLIYYIPWGNIGFYYNTAGVGYSDQTIHLGTYNASLEQLEQLEGGPITVEIAR